MIPPGLASIPFLTNPSFGAGIAAALGAVAAVYLARLLFPNRESAPAAPPPTTSDSCANHWEKPTDPAGECRKHRRRCDRPVQLQLFGPGDRQPRPAYVLDRSQGGLRLSVETPFPINAILRVRPTNAPDNARWLRAKVRWCSTEEGRHEIGCQFTDHSPFHVMLMFR
jgi:hypothetical protein